MRHRQPIGGMRGQATRLMFADQRFAPAAKSGHSRHHQLGIRSNQAGIHQRARQRQKTGWIAPWIGNPLRRGDLASGIIGQFRKTVNPAFRRPVRRRRINYPRAKFIGKRGGFTRRIIRQAQNRDVAFCHHRAPRIAVLAQIIIKHDGIGGRMGFQPFMYPQARCAYTTIDENTVCHGLGDTVIRHLMQDRPVMRDRRVMHVSSGAGMIRRGPFARDCRLKPLRAGVIWERL